MREFAHYSFRRIFKQSIVYGVALGSFLEIMNILDYTLGFQEQSQVVNNAKYMIRIFGLLLCIIIFRKRSGGYISFEEAFVFSLFTFVFAMFTCDTMVCITFNLYPELLHGKIEAMKEALMNAGVSRRLVKLSANYALWEKNPYYVILSFVIWTLFAGPILSFIFALMMQKNKASTN
ncbi:MAG: DUF4199 domain-containing protein [Prevotellaceae bacterium]|jgi:hypothetical protein|nr:DUF4199 domain-containing protein [Prevotellaceae bacterium]